MFQPSTDSASLLASTEKFSGLGFF